MLQKEVAFMTVQDLIDTKIFDLINQGENTGKQITGTFCCDLLSIAMSKAPAGSAWVTVMGNLNTLAVASLTDCACVILAEGIALDKPAINKAEAEGIAVLSSKLPIFDAALEVHKRLQLC